MPEPSYLYGSHYSTPGFILYYLVRKVKNVKENHLRLDAIIFITGISAHKKSNG